VTEFPASSIDSQTQYKLMIGSVTPRPIALVTTLGPDGPNAAPFSFFNALGAPPPMLMFSVGNRGKSEKDTVANILHCPEFVVHIVSDALREKMNVCSADYPRGINELERAGFDTAASRLVRPPRIVDCPIQLECRLMRMLELGERPYHVVIGEVVYFHYHDDVINERYYIDVGKVNPIGRLAGKGGYTRITDRFEMARPELPGVEAAKAE